MKYGDEDGCGAAYMISGLEAEGRARTLDELTEVPSPLGHLAGGGLVARALLLLRRVRLQALRLWGPTHCSDAAALIRD